MNNNTMTTRGKLAKTDLAYAAGIIDGEGWIIIEKRKKLVREGKKRKRKIVPNNAKIKRKRSKGFSNRSRRD